MGLDAQKKLRTWRLALVLILTFLLTWYFHIPEGEWALITACIVLFEYTTVGGVLTKSYLRFWATFSSGVYSMIVIYLFDNNVFANMIAVVVGLFVYNYFFMDTKKSYIGILGSITLTIMLLNYNNVDAAILRPFNIIIGIIISVCIFRLFYPEYAREKVMSVEADFIAHVCQMMALFLDDTKSLAAVKEEYIQHENNLIADIAAFNRYIEEAKIETKKTPLFIAQNIIAMNHIKRVYRLTSVLIYHLATEDIRNNAYVRHNFQEVMLRLQSLRSLILHPSDKKASAHIENDILWEKEIPIFHSQNPNQSNDHNVLFLKALFEGMIKQIALFERELNEITLIRLNHYLAGDV